MNGHKALINRKHSGYTAVEYQIDPIIGKHVLKPGAPTISCRYGGIIGPFGVLLDRAGLSEGE